MSFEVLPPTPRPLYRWVPVCPDHEAIETCPACALAAARRESARLSAELADARGWLREHAKWGCGHISEGTGGEPEACRICAVQDSESEARRALEWIRNRANDPSPFGPMHVLTEITERANDALAAEPAGPEGSATRDDRRG